jgi:hypothetical protein
VPHSLLAGAIALAWLLFRSGSKPSRLSYPCQQAAASTAWLAFGAGLIAALVALRRRLSARLSSRAGIVLGLLGLVVSLGIWGHLQRSEAYQGPRLTAPAEYRARVFHQAGRPLVPDGDRLPGLDELIEMMGGHGLKLHRSTVPSLTAGPEGILGADDVILIKINYQWSERGGTSTDLLSGMIRRIVEHPDGFSGEIVVCENAQFASVQNFDRLENNAEDTGQSPRDVVVHYQSQGWRISLFDWTVTRTTTVGEFSTGDMQNGYVVYPYDPVVRGRVSYPKFTTVEGTHVSLKEGIWTEAGGYERESLKLINMPVLKSHHSTYGATACVKNYMGVVTRELATDSHNAIRFGLLGAVQGEIRPADLNLLDATWINANPFSGPSNSYENATRRDELIASRDPVAADIHAVKNILIPGFLDNGYAPPWPWPSADPDDPTSEFREYLDNSMSQILAAGFDVTNDPAQIDAIDLGPPGEVSPPHAGEPFTIDKAGSGYELAWSFPTTGGPVEEYNLYRIRLTGTGDPGLPACEAALGNGKSAYLSGLPDDHAFIVVGRNVVGDGSFGRDSRGAERASPVIGDICP